NSSVCYFRQSPWPRKASTSAALRLHRPLPKYQSIPETRCQVLRWAENSRVKEKRRKADLRNARCESAALEWDGLLRGS
ncbi:unnamed protein product, partial [Linum tenue]